MPRFPQRFWNDNLPFAGYLDGFHVRSLLVSRKVKRNDTTVWGEIPVGQGPTLPYEIIYQEIVLAGLHGTQLDNLRVER